MPRRPVTVTNFYGAGEIDAGADFGCDDEIGVGERVLDPRASRNCPAGCTVIGAPPGIFLRRRS
jgi:hypothetical protein